MRALHRVKGILAAIGIAVLSSCDSPTGPARQAAVNPASACEGTTLLVVYNALPGETAPPPFTICLRLSH